MLMATLREGSPAPAPSKVMIAAAKPFIPKPGDGKDSQFTLSSASSSPAKPAVANEASVTDRPKSRPASPADLRLGRRDEDRMIAAAERRTRGWLCAHAQ